MFDNIPKNLNTITTTIITVSCVVLLFPYLIFISYSEMFWPVSGFLSTLGYCVFMLLIATLQRVFFAQILREAKISKAEDVRYRYSLQNIFEGFFQWVVGIVITVDAVLSISRFRSTGLSVVLFTLMGLYVLVFMVSLVKEHLLKESEEKIRANMKIRSILLVSIVFLVLVTYMVYAFVRRF